MEAGRCEWLIKAVSPNVSCSISKILFVEVEAEVFALSFDGFGQSRGPAVKHVHLPLLLLRHFLENLKQKGHILNPQWAVTTSLTTNRPTYLAPLGASRLGPRPQSCDGVLLLFLGEEVQGHLQPDGLHVVLTERRRHVHVHLQETPWNKMHRFGFSFLKKTVFSLQLKSQEF